MQNYIYNETKTRYVIVRNALNTDKYEYYLGCNSYGLDSEKIPRVHDVLWSSDPSCSFRRIGDAEGRLKGILKYESENDYMYFVCEIKESITIDANAPVGNVTVK